MSTIFDFTSLHLTGLLAGVALVAVLMLGWLAARHPHLARIGLRNVRRRGLRTSLIIFGLMLSTTFLATSLVIDDTILLAVQHVAVYNLGRVDEDILSRGGRNQLYEASAGDTAIRVLAGDSTVAGVAPALSVTDILAADITSRQARGNVSALGLFAAAAGPLGDLRTSAGAPAPSDTLGGNDVYINTNLQQLLSARPGDALDLYSARWAGKRFHYHVRAVVTGGLLGSTPTIVFAPAELQRITQSGDQINHIYVANAGDGLSGVAQSDRIARRLRRALPGNLRVDTVKKDGVAFSLRAQDIFARILSLYTLFALAVGVLLIFLIFVLLAAERRPELGMARVLGMRRGDVARMLLLEGAVYDALATLAGLLVGLGLGALIVWLVSPTVARVGFPLSVNVQPQSVLLAFCVGLLFTLGTMWLAAWTVSRMAIAAALRDLPEPAPPRPTLLALLRATGAATAHLFVSPRAALLAWVAALHALGTWGIIPLALGAYLLDQGVNAGDVVVFSLGVSSSLLGIVLVARGLTLTLAYLALDTQARTADPGQRAFGRARAARVADRISAVVIGLGLVLYWSLPFDTGLSLGLPRFSGGVNVFFTAAVMMVLGAILALAPNLDIALLPVRWVSLAFGRLRDVTRIALVYPAQQRFRTGVGLAMFSFVCFTMIVMACIAASTTQNYDNLPAQAAGYDIAGQPLFTPIGGLDRLSATLHANAPQQADGIAAMSAASPLPLGIIQPEAPNARWSVYPASQIEGAFLNGVGLPLVARADGYASDTDVWAAVRAHPGAVVIDAGALSRADGAALGLQQPAQPQLQQFIGPPIGAGLPGLLGVESLAGANGATAAQTGISPELGALVSDSSRLFESTLRLRNIVAGPGRIAPTTIWVSDLRGGPAAKLTIVGVVENARGQRYGLLGSQATFASVERGLAPFGNEYYYFQAKPGVDTHQEARAIGSALVDHGFESTVLSDVLLDVNGPQVYISRILIGLVGLMLFVGMAALAISGSRAVVERRQQIGMLRALGFRRWQVQSLFMIETALIGTVGMTIGLVLGLVFCRNIFAVDFFEPIRTGLTFVVPWLEVAGICLAALLASALAALLPAWQAGRVAPADALRYE